MIRYHLSIGRPIRILGLICFTIGVLVFTFYHKTALDSARQALSRIDYRSLQPANATLGFGAVYVVSGTHSHRRDRLLEAAAVTEIDLTVPQQQAWSQDHVKEFQDVEDGQSRIGSGSVKAWLSHHLVIRAFLESNAESALVLEDDVDWDIRLRKFQVPIAQAQAQSLLNSSSNPRQYPWGAPSKWDLLYIGHCGDYLRSLADGIGVGYHHPEDLERLPHVLAQDLSIPSRNDLHPFTASLLTAFQVPERTRVLHRSTWPLCTFGYAITRDTARRILDEIAPASEKRHGFTAYDAAILTACRDGPLRCYTLQPELFHHMQGESLIASEEQDQGKVSRPPVDEAGFEQTKYRGETSNIGCGFWSGDFYYNGDERKLQDLRDQIVRKEQCPKKAH